MEEKVCKCGCNEPMSGANNWEYKRGHKPKGKRLPPPSNALAKRERETVIDPPEAEEMVYVSCEIAVSQLDKIYNLLPAAQRGTAVLAGVEDLD